MIKISDINCSHSSQNIEDCFLCKNLIEILNKHKIIIKLNMNNAAELKTEISNENLKGYRKIDVCNFEIFD